MGRDHTDAVVAPARAARAGPAAVIAALAVAAVMLLGTGLVRNGRTTAAEPPAPPDPALAAGAHLLAGGRTGPAVTASPAFQAWLARGTVPSPASPYAALATSALDRPVLADAGQRRRHRLAAGCLALRLAARLGVRRRGLRRDRAPRRRGPRPAVPAGRAGAGRQLPGALPASTARGRRTPAASRRTTRAGRCGRWTRRSRHAAGRPRGARRRRPRPLVRPLAGAAAAPARPGRTPCPAAERRLLGGQARAGSRSASPPPRWPAWSPAPACVQDRDPGLAAQAAPAGRRAAQQRSSGTSATSATAGTPVARGRTPP